MRASRSTLQRISRLAGLLLLLILLEEIAIYLPACEVNHGSGH